LYARVVVLAAAEFSTLPGILFSGSFFLQMFLVKRLLGQSRGELNAPQAAAHAAVRSDVREVQASQIGMLVCFSPKRARGERCVLF